MNPNQRCHHYNECGNVAIYTLTTIEGKDIYVCESCDEDYSACNHCGKQDIYVEMWRANIEELLQYYACMNNAILCCHPDLKTP